ncbi:ATP-dependent DNA helicase RecQ [Tenacibaculum sp. 190524A02b]|uniref:ATP-dependent DNA helicase RecQ n=1 Tax=Tenacibaculum vairaonense TaxID=3137860 RepID=A0ABM9PR69_9FLAO
MLKNEALQILRNYWGYDNFRKPQNEIITSVLEGKDTIALLPTGGGKSICFQVPAILKKGTCIVVSPLIALMQDQVEALLQKNIKAVTIKSGSSQDEIITLFDNIRFGNYKFLYLSPERLQSKFIQDKIKQLNVNLVAIDEAHCISEWGHDFRPSYLDIKLIREIQPNVPFIALTATANNKVLSDITNHLQLETPVTFKKSFFRENLAYQVFFTDDKLYKLQQIFKKIKSPSIVYVSSRNKTREISNYLNAQGYKSSFYHGGLSLDEKQIAFEKWMQNKTPIMVATNAFGMGIDKANVRVVIHLNLPSSIENYVQEAGRAGRDQKKAFSVILTNKTDIDSFEEYQQTNYPTIKEIKTIHQKLYQHFQIAKGEHNLDSFDFDFSAFCSKYNFVPNKVSTTIQVLIANGIIELENFYTKNSTVQFLTSSQQIINYCNNNQKAQKIIQPLLRMYGGVFEQPIKINEFYIAKKTGVTSSMVINQLESLETKEYITYNRASKNVNLHFLIPREDDLSINRISKNVKAYFNQKKKKTTDLIRFVKNDTICRSIQLLSYFDEKNNGKCGICDVCLQQKNSTIKDLKNDLLKCIKKHTELSSKEICTIIPEKEEDILINLRKLLADEIIGITDYNKFYIK